MSLVKKSSAGIESVSVIFVNYHSLSMIAESIRSIYASSDNPPEVIVVSNSEWGTEFDQLQSEFPDVIWKSMNRNAGFGAANNAGARIAKGQYLFFLNPDTVVCNQAIHTLLEEYEKKQDIGAIGPKTLDSNQKHIGSCKGETGLLSMFYFLFPFALFFLPAPKKGISYKMAGSGPVDVINGSAMLLSKKLFEESGGFDERFFMYWEENDLCYRIWQAGLQVWYCDKAEVIHLGGKTTRSHFTVMEFQKHYSQRLYLEKHRPALSKVNRVFGILGYGWRTILSVITFNRAKISQFSSLFRWYLVNYERSENYTPDYH